jgi:hypothetical protein
MTGFVLVESFDLYATAADIFTRWSTPYQPEWVLAAGNNSVKALQLNEGGGAENAYRLLTAATATLTFGMHFKRGPIGADNYIFGFDLSSTGVWPFMVQHTPDGRIRVITWGGATIGLSSQFLIFPNGFNYIEVQAVLSATVGSIKVWVDNVLVINVAGINTIGSSGTLTVDRAILIEETNSGVCYYDNMYCRNDATRVGICEVLQYNAGRSDDFPGSQTTFALGTEAIYPWPAAANVQSDGLAIVGPAFSLTPSMQQSGFAICFPCYIQAPIKIVAPKRLPLYVFRGKGRYIQS